ncbi:hypothetical protein ACHAP8_000199 [Fusarium lateritium]
MTDSLLTLAATELLGLGYLGNGKDHYVLTYVSEVNSMGRRMGLFGVDSGVAVAKAKQVSPDMQSATSYTAWGTFNWIVLMALFYQQPGLSYPKYPPTVPIPGHTWHHSSEGSPQCTRQTLQETYMGDTFPVLCRFWRIMHGVTLKYYRDQPHPRESLSSHITLAFAEYKYRELIAWGETLPPSMSYGNLRGSFRFAETIGRSILSMTLQQGDISAEEARKLMEQFEENRLSSPSDDIRATFMADLNLAMTDPEGASVESLSDKFEDIALFREFTNGGGSSADEPMESDDNAWDTF